MFLQTVAKSFPKFNLQQKQTNNIVMITFWSQFASYALSSIFIIFLTSPILKNGLGFSQAKAYIFMGVSSATGYLMPILGGFMADNFLGLRRSILLGSFILACSYLLVVISSYTIPSYGDSFFLATYALIPGANSLLMGTASAMVSRIHEDNVAKAKAAMTYYYMAINIGALLATIIAPILLESRFGPLSVLAITFFGKTMAALNFAYRYDLYDDVVMNKDKEPLSSKTITILLGYLVAIYLFALFAYSFIFIAGIIITIGCFIGLIWFVIKTLQLKGMIRYKQIIASILIIEAIVFFILYNQMNSTLILFAKFNSDTKFLNFVISPAQYQMLNPLLIIFLGLHLPKFYERFPNFSIPYQFASGTLLASTAFLLLGFIAKNYQTQGLINGNFIAIAYVLITLAELWVSAIGLSMIGLYCDNQMIGFAMGVWYLACSLSNTISGRIAMWVAIPTDITSPIQSLPIYQHYYTTLGVISCLLGLLMCIVGYWLSRSAQQRGCSLG